MLVDISMPDKSGIQMIRELKEALPDTRFVIISMHSEADYIVEAFRAGATGYMVKESAASQLLKGLDTVAAGELFLDNALSQEVVFRLLQDSSDPQKGSNDPYSTLTPREQEVMRMLAEGLSPKDVAKQLFISPKTVENHRTNLMKKLGLKSTVELPSLRGPARSHRPGNLGHLALQQNKGSPPGGAASGGVFILGMASLKLAGYPCAMLIRLGWAFSTLGRCSSSTPWSRLALIRSRSHDIGNGNRADVFAVPELHIHELLVRSRVQFGSAGDDQLVLLQVDDHVFLAHAGHIHVDVKPVFTLKDVRGRTVPGQIPVILFRYFAHCATSR